MSDLVMPGQTSLDVQVMQAPTAEGHSVVMSKSGGACIAIVGGFTMLQRASLDIAAGLAAHGYFEPKDCADKAVEIAAATLVAAARKEQELKARVAPQA